MEEYTILDIWIDKYGRLRITRVFEKEEVIHIDIPDKPLDPLRRGGHRAMSG